MSRWSGRLWLIVVGSFAVALTAQPAANAACPVLAASCQAREALAAGEGIVDDTTEPVDTPVDVDPIVDDHMDRVHALLGGDPIDLPDPIDDGPGGGHGGTGPRPPGSPDPGGRGIAGGRSPDGPELSGAFGPVISAASGVAPPERGERATGSSFGDPLGGVARGLAIVLALFGLTVAFVAIQDHLDRNDPRLALAPVDSDVVEFA